MPDASPGARLRALVPHQRPWYFVARAGALGAPIGLALVAIGFVVLGSTWYQASGTTYLPEQIAYLASGATIGLGLVALGVGMLIAISARDDSERVEALLGRILTVLEQGGGGTAAAARPVWVSDGVVHVPGCLAVGPGEQPELLTFAAAEAQRVSDQRLVLCQLCRPDEPDGADAPAEVGRR